MIVSTNRQQIMYRYLRTKTKVNLKLKKCVYLYKKKIYSLTIFCSIKKCKKHKILLR